MTPGEVSSALLAWRMSAPVADAAAILVNIHYDEDFCTFSLDIRAENVVFFNIMKIDEIGLFLAERRKSLKVCQRDLAALSGVSEHALVNLERGIGNPTLKLVNAVADALGLELRLCVKAQDAT